MLSGIPMTQLMKKAKILLTYIPYGLTEVVCIYPALPDNDGCVIYCILVPDFNYRFIRAKIVVV